MRIIQLELGLSAEKSAAAIPRRARGQRPAADSAGRQGGSGVLGVEPLGEGGVPKPSVEGRGKAFPFMIAVSLLCLGLLADVTCAWNGNNYECSGEGNRVIVQGGGVIQLPPVVTNIVGVCTNCSAITPSQLSDLAGQIESEAQLIHQDCEYLKDQLTDQVSENRNLLNEISTYRTFDASVATNRGAATNYMYSVDNYQTAAMRAVWDNSTSAATVKLIQNLGSANGVYYYANNYVKPEIQKNNTALLQSYDYVVDIQQSADRISQDMVPQLRAGAVACEASWDGGGGGGGGGSVTNVSTGNWCTYDQGEALKRLLGQISNEVYKVRLNTAAISNFTEQCAYNIRTGLFTEYNAIPRNEQLLGGTWQDVYLEGNETNWGYQPTNILARIELLLYGMSGVASNSTAYSESSPIGSTETLDNIDEAKSDASAQIRAIDTDADGRPVESLGQALTAFFQAFNPQTSEHGGDEVIPAFSFTLNGQEFYSEPLFVDQRDTDVVNTLRSMCNTAAGIVYVVVSAWLTFMYWRWFAEWAVKLSRWAVELISSLFAS